MTDKEILEAMRSMLEPIQTDLQEVKQRVLKLEPVQAELQEVKQHVLKIEPVQAELQEVKQHVLKIEPIQAELQEVKQRVLKIEVTQENITNKLLNSIAEGVIGIQKKFDKLDSVEAKQEGAWTQNMGLGTGRKDKIRIAGRSQ